MKKIIQLLLFPLFLFVSCIGENMDDCPAPRTLIFKHHCLYDSDDSFDNWIGNDVMLYVFQDKVLKRKELIPYAMIKGGTPYSYEKECEGNVDIVAWAVPDGSATSIPQYDLGDRFNDKSVAHEFGTEDYNSFPIDLYLGVESIENDVISRESTHTVTMINCACLIDVTIIDPGGQMMGYTDHYVQVSGVMEQMNLYYDGVGSEAVVRDDVEGTTSFSSGIFGVLPSKDNQTLIFTVYSGGRQLAVVTTDQKAMPGGKIELTITLGAWASITVNDADWDEYVTNVQWM